MPADAQPSHQTGRIGLIALVIANLFVALQVLRHDWGYYETLLIFWTEVAVLGAYNVLRMLVVGVFGAEPLGRWAARWIDLGSRLNRLIYTVIGTGFFVVKFGTFTFVVGLFVLLLPAMLTPEGQSGGISMHRALAAAGPGLLVATGTICLSHGVSFLGNFLIGREYDRVSLASLFFLPYARMSLVAGVLLAGIAVARTAPSLDRATGFALVMVLFKLVADAISHSLEHGWLMAESPPQHLPPGDPSLHWE